MNVFPDPATPIIKIIMALVRFFHPRRYARRSSSRVLKLQLEMIDSIVIHPDMTCAEISTESPKTGLDRRAHPSRYAYAWFPPPVFLRSGLRSFYPTLARTWRQIGHRKARGGHHIRIRALPWVYKLPSDRKTQIGIPRGVDPRGGNPEARGKLHPEVGHLNSRASRANSCHRISSKTVGRCRPPQLAPTAPFGPDVKWHGFSPCS